MATTEKPETTVAPLAEPAPPTPPRITVAELSTLPHSPERTHWINGIVQIELDRLAYLNDLKLARQFALAGVLDDIKGATIDQATAQAFLKIRTGRDLGLSPTDSLQSIYFAANGKPSLQNDIFASKLQEAGYSWDADFEEGEVKDAKGHATKVTVKCTLWLLRANPLTQQMEPVLYTQGTQKGQPISESFSMEDARSVRIWEKQQVKLLSEKWNFQSWPRNMLYWRAMSRLRQFHFPHILRGIIPQEERFDVMREPDKGQKSEYDKMRAQVLDTQAELVGDQEV
jgi:hypothetical protein